MSTSKVEVVVDGNVNPLQQAMDKAGDIVDRAGHKMAKKFDKAFGAGMIAGVAFGLVKDFVFKPFEVASEIKSGAKDLGVTAEEFQAISAGADAAGMSVGDFIQQIKDSANPIAQAKKVMTDFSSSIKLSNEDIDTLTQSMTSLKGVAVTVGGWFATAIRGWADVFTFLGTPSASWKQIEADSFRQSEMANSKAGEISAGFTHAVTTKSESPNTDFNKVQNGALGAIAVTAREQVGAFVGGSTGDVVTEIRRQTVAVETNTREVSEMKRNIDRLIQQAGF